VKIKSILNYIQNIDVSKYHLAEDFVKEGYGQTTGGYLSNTKDHPSQLEHFVNYYCDKIEKMPTFASLWCPELIIFISEILGVKKEYIIKASEMVKNFEDDNNLKNTQKNATYLTFRSTNSRILKEFKETIKIYDVNDILKKTTSIEEAIRQIEKL